MSRRLIAARVFATLLGSSIAGAAVAQNNACDMPGDVPDVIVGDLHNHQRWGAVSGITSYSIGTYSCNVGTCWLNWYSGTPEHPVIGQNMFRLKDGRFEQVGQSWLKHGFFALNNELCESNCLDTNGQHLGVNCSDPYGSSLNGGQDGLGPKFEVNASTGVFPFPATDLGNTGNAIYKRLQVRNADLDPEANPGAVYFVEGQYIAADDAAAANDNNNASHREIAIEEDTPSVYDFEFVGPTVREQPAIQGWATLDPAVQLVNIDIVGDGRFILGTKVTSLGGGMWHYEYALHNLNSHRSAGSFAVAVPAQAVVTNIGFHDVDYHSGEPFVGTDWAASLVGGVLTWQTEPFVANPNANALRWGTLYNFRFDTNVPPVSGPATIGLFRPGMPATIAVATSVPTICNSSGTCEAGESCVCLDDCPGEGPDGDADGVGVCLDCADEDPDNWATPAEVTGVLLTHEGANGTTLSWSPAGTGGLLPSYDVIRSNRPSSFQGPGAICLQDSNATDTAAVDLATPVPDRMFCYLVRALNGCPDGVGPLGSSFEAPACP
jgi:hypothetical protein